MKKPQRPDPDGLIGMWGHTINDDGQINWQFQIIRRSEDLYICQLYSWVDCGPTESKAISREVILSDSVKLYATDELMNEASKKDYDRKRWDGAVS